MAIGCPQTDVAMSVITVRELPTMGRVGNQLFAYCFAKGYALHHRCEFQVPDWWGRRVFINANEPFVTAHLPQTELEGRSSQQLGYFFGRTDIDINAFAQHQMFLDYYTRAYVREWLKLKPEWERYAPKGVYSAMHIRRGDYLSEGHRNHYCEISELSYERAIEKFQIPRPVIRVSEETNSLPEGWNHADLSWLPDFLTLRNAAYLIRANSTFSWWAGTLGHGKVYSPFVHTKVGLHDVDFVEGNHENTAGVFPNQSDLSLRAS